MNVTVDRKVIEGLLKITTDDPRYSLGTIAAVPGRDGAILLVASDGRAILWHETTRNMGDPLREPRLLDRTALVSAIAAAKVQKIAEVAISDEMFTDETPIAYEKAISRVRQDVALRTDDVGAPFLLGGEALFRAWQAARKMHGKEVQIVAIASNEKDREGYPRGNDHGIFAFRDPDSRRVFGFCMPMRFDPDMMREELTAAFYSWAFENAD